MATVYEMVREVMAETREKQASLARPKATPTQTKMASAASAASDGFDPIKVAESCEWLAENMNLVVDARTPQQKLAEYAAIHQALLKAAEDPPMTPVLDAGQNPGGPNSAMQASENTTPGSNAAEANQQGIAMAAHQPLVVTTPGESPTPASASNAMPTNVSDPPGGTAEQPADVLKQAAMQKLIKQAGVPAKFALVLGGLKLAEDALFPAQISAGTEPALQTAASPSPVQSQGTEAGEGTPRETAPTSGEGGGRELLSSNEAAINATKGQAKAQNKGALSQVLTEPAMSSATDHTLDQQLDNTAQAGVKISAAKALLKKWASASSANQNKLAQVLGALKQAEGEAAPAETPLPEPVAIGADGGPPPPAEELGVQPDAEGAGVTDEALLAAASGVTPEQLAMAQILLASQQPQVEGVAA